MSDDRQKFTEGELIFSNAMGLCRVAGIELKNICGQDFEMIRLVGVSDPTSQMFVPIGKLRKMDVRRIAAKSDVERLLSEMRNFAHAPEKNVRVRRDRVQKLEQEGTIQSRLIAIMELLSHALTTSAKNLEKAERNSYDKIRRMLVSEASISLGVPPSAAEDAFDYQLFAGKEGVCFSSAWNNPDNEGLADVDEELEDFELLLDEEDGELLEEEEEGCDYVLSEALSLDGMSRKGRDKWEPESSENVRQEIFEEKFSEEEVRKTKKSSPKGMKSDAVERKTDKKIKTDKIFDAQFSSKKPAKEKLRSSRTPAAAKKKDPAVLAGSRRRSGKRKD